MTSNESARPEVAPTGPLAAGQLVLERYLVLRRLHTHRHSAIYLAEDRRLQRPVCIKVYRHAGERDHVRRACYEHFIQEAFVLSRLTRSTREAVDRGRRSTRWLFVGLAMLSCSVHPNGRPRLLPANR